MEYLVHFKRKWDVSSISIQILHSLSFLSFFWMGSWSFSLLLPSLRWWICSCSLLLVMKRYDGLRFTDGWKSLRWYPSGLVSHIFCQYNLMPWRMRDFAAFMERYGGRVRACKQADFAALSASSLPRIPQWPPIQLMMMMHCLSFNEHDLDVFVNTRQDLGHSKNTQNQ